MSKKILLLFVLALGIGAAVGYWYAIRQSVNETDTSAALSVNEKKPLYYRNPMNPAITSPTPAKDSMGMDYIPVYAGEENGAKEPTGTVRIDPVTVQNIGVRTARVEQRDLSHDIRAVGRVDFNEERLSRLHPKTEGWIEDLLIDKTGEMVNKDTILLNIYSPQLVTSQQEYLLALNSLQALKNSPYEDIRRGAGALVTTSRERLEFLDVPEHQIRELEETRQVKKSLHIQSPFKGTVIQVGARAGQYVTPDTELYMLADLTRIWVYVDIYENELPWIRIGDGAEMEVTGIPGEVFAGKVNYIYPYLENKTRTNRVRLEFDNKELRLKPEMFANVTVKTSLQKGAVVVPSEAIVRSGTSDQIFVVREPGKFEPRTVTLGVNAMGMTQILSGIKPGEEVVTSSQFLIDSESKLREATEKMMEILQPGPGSTTTKSDGTAERAATHDNETMPAMATGQTAATEPPSLPTQVPGIGIVKKVMREEHKINIEHQPIAELDWPTMTMDFDVAADVGMADVDAGDHVQFTLNPDASFHYVITALQEIQSVPVTGESSPAEAGIMAMGIVKKVMAAEHKLNITHDPIETLGWPAMTMDFEVAAAVDLAGLKPGERIHFGLEKDASSNYRITSIHRSE